MAACAFQYRTLNSRLQHSCLSSTRRSYRACRLYARRNPSQEKAQGGLDPALESSVPVEQRPVNELSQLKESFVTSWANLPLPGYLARLGGVFFAAFLLLSGPVAAQTFDPLQEPLRFTAAGTLGALLAAGAASLRMYLSWKYVGDRLLTASLAYEETGWYDGQVFVKPPEVLMRDRLLGIYQVKPVLARLTRTLQAVGASTAALALALLLVTDEQALGLTDATGRRVPAQVTPNGIIFSQRVKDLSELKNDDEAAQAEAQAQAGMPGYCGDRTWRAVAGGQYCRKFDVR